MQRFLTGLFVSDTARHDAEAVRLVMRAVLFGLAIAVFAPLYLLAGAKWSAVTVFTAGLICVLILFALRWGMPTGVVVHLLCCLAYCAALPS